MNNEDFVTYEQALALKKLGFKEDCYNYYDSSGHIQDNDVICNKVFQAIFSSQLLGSHNSGLPKVTCDAPTLAQAQKWLNKIKDLKLFIIPSPSDRVPYSYTVFNTAKTIYKNPPRYYSSYEESLSAGITECLKLLENG